MSDEEDVEVIVVNLGPPCEPCSPAFQKRVLKLIGLLDECGDDVERLETLVNLLHNMFGLRLSYQETSTRDDDLEALFHRVRGELERSDRWGRGEALH